jgi:hypothetical protein
MKNRSRPFHCDIAGKTVNITLRHGGGLQEPAKVYVRCDERDCQYVDLNEAPCPLRVEMFADGSDRRVADYLGSHVGTQWCYACLTEVLGITHDQVRRASWQLKDEPGVLIRPARCSACRHRRVTIGLARAAGALPAAVRTAPIEPDGDLAGRMAGTRDLAVFLRAQPGYAFCAHCLARELNVRPAETRDAMWALDSAPDFVIRTAQCVSCLLTKPVIRHDESTSEADAPRRVIGVLVQSAGLPFCATCVAFTTDLALAEVRRVLQNLESVPEFVRREAACSECERWQTVISFHAAEEMEAERIAEIGDVLSGQVHHRGFRIDLRSYRTSNGWRPLALVKSGIGALVPDAPPIVLDTMRTKVEADELAAARAREWIDKRVS